MRPRKPHLPVPDAEGDLFAFVSDKTLRGQCARDFAEMESCLAKSAYKAVVVLAGSIIETVLFDRYREESPTKDGTKKVTLFDLLDWAHAEGIISNGVFVLAGQIRCYRNAIHPAVTLRETVEINEHIALIAYNLLLEVIRSSRHFERARADKSESVLRSLIRDKLHRDATCSELSVYVPVMRKYGTTKGAIIVERSMRFAGQIA